ncbi:MAG: hypothetical protein JW955_24490 [Sedimentisphaerales bacterium]|nr:hypothetical protein [Sedimentisphaerales bacterium]
MTEGGPHAANAVMRLLETPAKMRSAEAFRTFGWDFENVWMIREGKEYPRLRWEGVRREE